MGSSCLQLSANKIATAMVRLFQPCAHVLDRNPTPSLQNLHGTSNHDALCAIASVANRLLLLVDGRSTALTVSHIPLIRSQ